MKKLIGSCRREGIDWIQDHIGEAREYAEVSIRPVAECAFFHLLENKTIVSEDCNFYLTEDLKDEELKKTTRVALKARNGRTPRRTPHMGMKSANTHRMRVGKKPPKCGLTGDSDPSITGDSTDNSADDR